jgi:hypothetical protein
MRMSESFEKGKVLSSKAGCSAQPDKKIHKIAFFSVVSIRTSVTKKNSLLCGGSLPDRALQQDTQRAVYPAVP